MSTITLEAELRTLAGKGASRRLRRLEGKVPAIVYGGSKKPQNIHLLHKTVMKAFETESIFSSVFDLKIDGKSERVILKDVQRHPYKPLVLHMDLQRVSLTDILVKLIPVHFINQEEAKGVKEGGVIQHTMTQIEVKCQAKNLPEFIEIDMADVELDQVIHLSHLKLPEGVELTADLSDHAHDAPVVSIHIPKEPVLEEEEPEEVEGEEGEELAEEGTEEASEASEEKAKTEGSEDEHKKEGSE